MDTDINYCSNCEIETQILLSGDLKCLKAESLSEMQQDIGEVERMLKALIKSLKKI
ncbi:MAG: four helix bundle protein [Desulfobacterales bacterium]